MEAAYGEGFAHDDALGNLTCKSAGSTLCGSSFGLGSLGPHQPASWGPYTDITYDENGGRLAKDRGNGTRQEYAYGARGRINQIDAAARPAVSLRPARKGIPRRSLTPTVSDFGRKA